MNQISLIQTYYKGFSCYVPKTKLNLILKDIYELFSNERGLTEHFFLYFDGRLGRGLRIFFQTEFSSESLQSKFLQFLKKYTVENKNLNTQHQFFKTYPPFSVVPMRFIEQNDEIFTRRDNLQSVQNLLKNLSLLITQKTGEFDFGNVDEKLEFTLELLIAGVAFNQLSSLSIQKEFKFILKSIPGYKKYLDDNYARTVKDSDDIVDTFKKSLILEENKNNLLTLFWEINKVVDTIKVFEIIFKVLDIDIQQKCYCLYVLQNTQ